MELWGWLGIAALCASGAMTPGPSLAVVVKNTVAGGRRQGVLCGLGHGLGVGVYAFAAVAGFSAVVGAAPMVGRALSVCGGLFLIVLGWRALQSEAPTVETRTGSGRGFAEGFVTAFLNPKIAVFFLALLGSFVPEQSSLLTRAGVALLALSIDAVWYVFAALALAGTGGAEWLASRGTLVMRVTGVLLVGLGVLAVVAELA